MQTLQLKGEVVVKRESSPLSDLELGISSYYGGVKSKIKEEADQIVFTAEQIQELYIQAAIFRYLLSGLPVPIHLVLPIWSSVASSLGPDSTGIYRHFPTLATVFAFGDDFDCRSLMDPQPGRCRRTDGKKWRCYKEVVPLQKYCERHMHRGSHRSRKRVETAEKASAISSYNYAPPLTSAKAASPVPRTAVAVSTSLDLTVPCSDPIQSAPRTFKDGSSFTCNIIRKSKGKKMVGENCGTNAGSLVRVLADKNNTKYQSDYGSGKGVNDSDHIINSKMMDGSNNNSFSDASMATGFGSSPKSVLQLDKGNKKLPFLVFFPCLVLHAYINTVYMAPTGLPRICFAVWFVFVKCQTLSQSDIPYLVLISFHTSLLVFSSSI
ncbi:OLC1v1038963C1 [Oldenlandia corymbosa var. corymbosa]|uniref:Growth-regulating factor n=1 Tax=Oldenlandia corymbosa var. corymbosa TaxID=529605 RepID=A0AAV1D432_OLDCO|nr:OLC1v1038963C1 [Oldenlandia corymbosa var. corymbosa]